jgi:GntR family transcriptional regulator / MocR family aminotransferase
LVLPDALVDPVLAIKASADYTGVREQLVLADFIRTGAYDRHVRARRLAYRRRRNLLVRALAGVAPGVALTGIAAGLHALLLLPEGVREEEVTLRAARHDVLVSGLRQYRAGGRNTGPLSSSAMRPRRTMPTRARSRASPLP